MGLQRTFIGALAFTTARGYSAAAAAAAFPGSSFLDLVGFIQHSVKGTVYRDSESRSDVSPGGSPLSLLAVHTVASTKWYETNSDDGPLLQKLADRMKANEQHEEEQAAIAQANSSGAAFLSQGKSKTRQWLTQSDLDHISEDEVELEELAVKLQRIAFEAERIVKHQLELGKRLDLPDPTVERFEVNDKVEIQIGKGNKNAGRWIKAVVKAWDARTNRYTIHIPSLKEDGSQDKEIPPKAIRRDEEASKDEDFKPTALTYEVGEQAQIKVTIAKGKETWAKCKIRSIGGQPDTYNIHIPEAPKGHKDMSDVPAQHLRKSNATKLFTQYDADGDGLLTDLEFAIALKEKANHVTEHSTETDDVYSTKALFATGEQAEVLSENQHIFEDDVNFTAEWTPCTIISEGDIADSYNLFVPNYTVGFQYLSNTPVDRLRKIGAEKEAFDQKVKLIPSFVDHEVIAPRGLYKNHWVPCQLKRKSPDDTYTVWMPFGVKQGHNTVAKIPQDRIRARKTCGPGYDDIFRGDVSGNDHFGRLNNFKKSVEECAADCNKRFECLSFEYSAEAKVCNLNKVQNPNNPMLDDQMFCRRTEIPTVPKFVWTGPLIGQPLEFVMTVGEHAGEWHTCTVASFGTKPDTYTVNASIDFTGSAEKYTSLPDVPVAYLRYQEDKPVQALERWEPPQGADAIWAPRNDTNTTTEKKKESATKLQSFLITNTDLKDEGGGLLFRSSKNLKKTIGESVFAGWGSYVTGVDEGDGWVRVGQTYLPTVLKGLMVITPRINGEPGEQVQVRRKDGVWAPATIRSPGDAPNTFNVKMVKGSTGKFMNNLPVARMRKEISVPRVAPVVGPRAALVLTTRPPAAPALPLAAAAPAAASPSTTAAPQAAATTSIVGVHFEDFLKFTRQQRKPQESKEEQERSQLEQELNATGGEGEVFLIDNRLLKHTGPGLSYRFSKRLDDNKGRSAMAYWGSYVVGVNEGDGWIRVGEKYLPTTVRGVPVVTQKVAGGFGEIVEVERDDGTWAHGTMRSKGDWPNTFNVHVMDNGAGYDLDNMPTRRLRRDLETTKTAGSQEEVVKPKAPLSELDEAFAPEEILPLTGDLGQDLTDGEYRANMTAEVKLNAGPQAGSWVRCRVVDRGDITETYNLYVPSAPRGYQDMHNVPSLAMRKLSALPAATNQTANNHIEVDSIDGEPGESVEVMVRKGPRIGTWMPAVVVGPGTVPDSYNVRLPGERSTHKDAFNVPGVYLRKAKFKVEIGKEEDYPVYVPGEIAQIVLYGGEVYDVNVTRQGDFSNTYDVVDAQQRVFPGVHAMYMRKKVVVKVVEATTTPAPTQEPSVLNMQSIMQVVMALRMDLTPVFSWLTGAKKELRLWKVRSGDWEQEGCSAEDRHAFVARLDEMGKATSEQVLAGVPEECHMSTWAPGGKNVAWDELATCFQTAARTSRSCAFCPVKFLLSASTACLSKCQPMLNPCSADQAGKICATKTSHCLECLQEPAEHLMQCMDFPNATDAVVALQAITKSAKGGQLDVEGGLKAKLAPDFVERANHMARSALYALMSGWKAVMGRA